jgi:hypothetical protein
MGQGIPDEGLHARQSAIGGTLEDKRMDVEELFGIAFSANVPDGRSMELEAYQGEQVGGRLAGRHGTFNRSFYRGLEGERMGQNALEQHTWSNDGYRVGCIVRAAILLSQGQVDVVSERDRKRLADSIFLNWTNLTRSVIEEGEDAGPE